MSLLKRRPQIIGLVVRDNIDMIDELGRCDFLEMRFDTFPREEWEEVFARAKKQWPDKPLIATIRLVRDGGEWPDEQASERVDFLEKLARTAAVEWIDAELQSPEWVLRLLACRKSPTRILLSCHDLLGAPEKLSDYEALWSVASSLGADGVKVVVMFSSHCQYRESRVQGNASPLVFDREKVLYDFISLHAGDERLLAAFAMGEAGRTTRIEAPRRGAPWSYGFVGKRAPAAGQWSVEELRRLFSKIA